MPEENKAQVLEQNIIKLASEKVTEKLQAEYKGMFEELQKEIKKLNDDNKNLQQELSKSKTLPSATKEVIPLSDIVHKAIGRTEYCVTKADTLSTLVGANGGLLIPTETRSGIVGLEVKVTEVVKPRAMVIPAGGPNPDGPVLVPCRGQTSTGAFSRAAFAARQEGSASSKTDFKLADIELQPRIRSAYIDVSNTLIGNVPGINALVGTMMREAEIYENDALFINGTGVSQPLGILKAPSRKEVTRNTAASIKYQDITKMMGTMVPYSMPYAIWVASFSLYEQLANMVDAANHLIMNQGDITKQIPMTLLGRPIVWSEECSVLGTAGDLILADFSYYLIKEGSGPFLASSRDYQFTSQLTTILYEWAIDGKPWLNAPIVLKDGSTTVSPFVVLK